MEFCNRCGKPVPEGEVCSCQTAPEKAAPRKEFFKRNGWLLLVGGLVLLLVTILICVSSCQPEGPQASTGIPAASTDSGFSGWEGLPQQIDLSKYIVITCQPGLNGQGVLDYHLDESLLQEDMIAQYSGDELTGDIMATQIEMLTEYGNALRCITLRADKETDLSNGDVVTVTAIFSNDKEYEFHCTFRNGVSTYTVAGLKEGTLVDPFSKEFVAVNFTGFSGTGLATHEVLTNEGPASFFYYRLYNFFGLSNGDTVTLKVSADVDALLAQGYYLPESLEKEYVVSGLTEYYTMTDAFPAAELQALCADALRYSEDLEADDRDSNNPILEPSSVQSAYFVKALNPQDPHYDDWHSLDMDNAVLIVTTYTRECMSVRQQMWAVWVFPNYYFTADGTILYEEQKECSFHMGGESLAAIEAWIRERYEDMTVSQIPLC